MRGSLRPAASCADSTSLTASLTLRIRAPGILAEHLVAGDKAALDPNAVGELRLDVARELGAGVIDDRWRAPDERRRERGALPEIVVVGLGDGRAEPLLEVRLQRLDLLALALEAGVIGEVQVDLDQADEAYSSSLST